MHHPERVHTRSQLLDKVWGRHAVLDERTVDTHVGRLRNALQPSGHQEHIETVRGTGYRFVAWNARVDWSGAA
jgi:two-component system phosphate regulon response regulator PhoB